MIASRLKPLETTLRARRVCNRSRLEGRDELAIQLAHLPQGWRPSPPALRAPLVGTPSLWLRRSRPPPPPVRTPPTGCRAPSYSPRPPARVSKHHRSHAYAPCPSRPARAGTPTRTSPARLAIQVKLRGTLLAISSAAAAAAAAAARSIVTVVDAAAAAAAQTERCQAVSSAKRYQSRITISNRSSVGSTYRIPGALTAGARGCLVEGPLHLRTALERATPPKKG